jgi:hypothetical protein
MQFPSISVRTYAISFFYVLATMLFHWLLTFDWGVLFYILGAAIGLHLFELTEQFILAKNPATPQQPVASPLRRNSVQLLLVVVSIFVLSSTGSTIGAGLVLLMNLRLLDLQYTQFQKTGALSGWFPEGTPKTTQTWYLYGMAMLFIVETLLFVFV